ncbi:MAG: RsmD family RNA methyltransferase, partial [Bacillota bacterium]
VPGSRVLDLCSGSGNLGFEAISRGAAHAVLCDQSRSAAELIRRNADKLGIADRVTIVCSDYRQLLLRSDIEPFDIVFLDPPYESDLAHKAAVMILQRNLLKEGGLIAIEHDAEHVPLPVAGLMRIRDTRRYGSVRLSFAERE